MTMTIYRKIQTTLNNKFKLIKALVIYKLYKSYHSTEEIPKSYWIFKVLGILFIFAQ